MKLLFSILFCLPLVGIAQFVDDFSDGDLTSNPSWQGDVSLFTINGDLELQTSGPAQADTAILYHPFQPNYGDTIEWQFYWEMGFDPSNNNNGRVYLISSDQDLADADSAYYLRIGENGSDDRLELFVQNGSSSSSLITGTTNFSSSPSLMVYVVRFPFGGWQLFADAAGGENFSLEGSTVDASVVPSGFFGLFCKYTSSNSSKFTFDDIQVDSFIVDTIPPALNSVNVLSNNSLEIVFSEPLDLISAQTASNYAVDNGIGTANTAVLGADSITVTLGFSSTFVTNTTYELTVSGVEDLDGNEVVNGVTTFEYLEFITPQYRDVVINEIMADFSPPPLGLPEAEFIEIYNASSGYIDLSNLEISDLASSGTPTHSQSIAPGAYAILCDDSDSALFATFGDVVQLNSLPLLNNEQEDLTLTIDGVVIDRVRYDDSWYRDGTKAEGGFTLEQINPTAVCTGEANWIGSESVDGGTPGGQNSVFNDAPDTLAPVLVTTLVDSVTIIIEANESLDSLSVFTASYVLDPSVGSINVASIQPFAEVVLTLGNPIEPGVLYDFGVTGISDCAGNELVTQQYVLGVGAQAMPFDLIINELFPEPEEGATLPPFEFVEIYNRSDKLISTENLHLADRSGGSALENALIAPGEYVILCDNSHGNDFREFGKVIEVGSMPSLNNSDDDIYLYAGDEVIDVVPYTDEWYGQAAKADGGWTLERKNLNGLCDLSTNWEASNANIQGTPGAINSEQVDGSETVASLIQTRIKTLQSVELLFDARLDTLEEVNVLINDDPYRTKPTLLSPSIEVELDQALERGQTVSIQIDSFRNCAFRKSTATSSEVYLHDSGDVIINEILFNPRGSGTDYVEVFNRTQQDILLEGWSFGYYDSNDSLRFNVLSSASLNLSGDGYLAFTEDNQNVAQNYPFAVQENLRQTDLPSYSNDEGEVLLFDQFGLLMDSVYYSEDMHFALIKDFDGVSLERLDAARSSTDEGNWHSASVNDNYGTPGYLNSQDYSNGAANAEVELSAEFISPDNDGYQDVLNISYSFPEPGYSMTIEVYTENGALIKTIASNDPIGAAGVYTWDGTTDNGDKARTGIHIILVDAFNLDNEKSRFKLPVVVASKL